MKNARVNGESALGRLQKACYLEQSDCIKFTMVLYNLSSLELQYTIAFDVKFN